MECSLLPTVPECHSKVALVWGGPFNINSGSLFTLDPVTVGLSFIKHLLLLQPYGYLRAPQGFAIGSCLFCEVRDGGQELMSSFPHPANESQ